MFKKVLCICLALVLALSLIGCGKNEGTADDLTGKTAEQVLGWALEKNIEQKVKYDFVFSDTVEAGKVVSQSVNKGEKIEDEITVQISKGPEQTDFASGKVSVPNCIGKYLCDAIEECSSAGINEGETIYKKSSLPVGTVLMTDPIPGTSLDFGASSVNFICAEQIEGSKKVPLFVDWESDSIAEPEITLKAYIDGSETPDKEFTVNNSSCTNTYVYFEAIGGKQQLKITLNDTVTKNYEIDFDNGEFTQK